MIVKMMMVGVGGAAGSFSRYTLTKYLENKCCADFPVATFLVNLSGSLFLGMLCSQIHMNWLWLIGGIGFLGGFTTFSAFNLELVKKIKAEKYLASAWYLLLSYFGSIALALLGIFLGGQIWG